MWPKGYFSKLFPGRRTNEAESMEGSSDEYCCEYPRARAAPRSTERDSSGIRSKGNAKTPISLLKKLWYLKRRGSDTENYQGTPLEKKLHESKVASMRRMERKKNRCVGRSEQRKTQSRVAMKKLTRRVGRSVQRKTLSPKRSSRKRVVTRRMQRKSQTIKKRTRRKRRTYPTRTKDRRNIRVRKIIRYTNGEEERQRPQVRPLASRSAEWNEAVDDSPKFLRKHFEKDPCEREENPLDIGKLHSAYVKSLTGVPAKTLDSQPKRRRRYSNSKNRRASSRRRYRGSKSKSADARRKAERAFRLRKRRVKEKNLLMKHEFEKAH